MKFSQSVCENLPYLTIKTYSSTYSLYIMTFISTSNRFTFERVKKKCLNNFAHNTSKKKKLSKKMH